MAEHGFEKKSFLNYITLLIILYETEQKANDSAKRKIMKTRVRSHFAINRISQCTCSTSTNVTLPLMIGLHANSTANCKYAVITVTPTSGAARGARRVKSHSTLAQFSTKTIIGLLGPLTFWIC